MRKVIIDTDPGVDDAYAIWTALRVADFECLGICTVAGNKSIDMVTQNALRIIEYVNKEYIPVYQGACAPLKRVFHDAGAMHGDNGVGGVSLPNRGTSAQERSAVDFIVDAVKTYPGEIEIIALGPLTNIAVAIQKYPNIMKKVKAIWSMGGGAYIGNITPYAEFNYWADPDALEIVLKNVHDTQFYMIGLDATHKAKLSLNDLMFMKICCDNLGEILWDMTLGFMKKHWLRNRNFQIVMHDLLALLVAVDSSLCTFKPCWAITQTEGERMGQTVCNFCAKKHNIFVAFEPNESRYRQLFFSILFPNQAEEHRNNLL